MKGGIGEALLKSDKDNSEETKNKPEMKEWSKGTDGDETIR